MTDDEQGLPRPWTRSQLEAVAAANAIGGALIATSYGVCSGLSSLNRQIGWINLAVIGAAVAGFANAALLFCARRAFRLRFRAITAVVGTMTAPSAAPQVGRDGWVWVSGGGTLAHRPDCPFVEGRPTSPADAQAVRKHGLRRCGVCA